VIGSGGAVIPFVSARPKSCLSTTLFDSGPSTV
jgi:hypothetical protein